MRWQKFFLMDFIQQKVNDWPKAWSYEYISFRLIIRCFISLHKYTHGVSDVRINIYTTYFLDPEEQKSAWCGLTLVCIASTFFKIIFSIFHRRKLFWKLWKLYIPMWDKFKHSFLTSWPLRGQTWKLRVRIRFWEKCPYTFFCSSECKEHVV